MTAFSLAESQWDGPEMLNTPLGGLFAVLHLGRGRRKEGRRDVDLHLARLSPPPFCFPGLAGSLCWGWNAWWGWRGGGEGVSQIQCSVTALWFGRREGRKA